MTVRGAALVTCLLAAVPLAACGQGQSTSASPATAATVAAATAPIGHDPVPSPPARFSASMAYDAAARSIVLFGGQASASAGGQYLGDTWLWDGHHWTQAHPAVSPPPRMAASMAYDAGTRTVVLFGGEGNVSPDGIGPFSDTWTWDGTTWSRRHPSTSPAARRSAPMASYPPGDGVLLFGGDIGAGMAPNFVSELWLWKGGNWSLLHPTQSPSISTTAEMVYDDATGSVLLYCVIGQEAEMWSWSGSSWVRQHPSLMPTLRDSGALAYDPASKTVVLYGGENLMQDPPYLWDTWNWDGLTWSERSTHVHPPAVAWASMAYDGVTHQLLLFGGFGTGGSASQGQKPLPLDPTSTWLWDGSTWTRAIQP